MGNRHWAPTFQAAEFPHIKTAIFKELSNILIRDGEIGGDHRYPLGSIEFQHFLAGEGTCRNGHSAMR